MKDPLKTGFADRQKAAAEAKQALLAKLKPKPAIQAENFVPREVERQAELEALRLKRKTDREAAKEAVVVAAVDAEQAALNAKREERKARKAEAKSLAKLKKELRR